MIVVADSNEQATNPNIISLMTRTFPKMAIASLAFGDYNVILSDGSILAVERKNVGDFLGSIADGRVFRQVEEMSVAQFSCIVMVGELRFNKEDMTVADGRLTGWRGKSVRAAIMAVQFSGCPIFWCSGDNWFPETVMEIIEFVSQPVEHMQRRKRSVTFPPVDLSVDIIGAFPGIGLKRAQALMEFVAPTDYNSLGGAIAWASAFPLLQEGSRPEGWGNKTVQNFRAMLGLGKNQYLEIKEDTNGKKRR